MKEINLTLDNGFRHPLRWGRCPVTVEQLKIYGLKIKYGEHMPTSFKKRWSVVLFYGKSYRIWSNYPIKD